MEEMGIRKFIYIRRFINFCEMQNLLYIFIECLKKRNSQTGAVVRANEI